MIVAYYLPDTILDNKSLSLQFDKSENEIFKISGVQKRHIRGKNEIGSDLGFAAARKLLATYDFQKKIDFLIFCTEGLDYKAPTTSSVLHHRLGLNENCGCIDLPMGCTGFVFGLSVADALLKAGNAECVLLINADIPSSVIHSDDFELRVLFGDAGSAVIIEKQDTMKVGKFVFGNDGSGAKNLIVENGSTRHQIDAQWLELYKNQPNHLKHGRMHMNGIEILRFSLKRVPMLLEQVLKKNNLLFGEIDLFVFHQASQLILKMLKRKCSIPDEKFYTYYESVGNTVSCSIPIALSHAFKDGKIKKGDKVMVLGFGVGYSWGGTVITF